MEIKTAKNSLVNSRGAVAEIKPVAILQNLLKENNKKLKAVLGDNAGSFMVSLVNLYNTDLDGALPESVLNAAFIAAVLKLPIEKNLGFAYIVPYKNNKEGIKTAQFQLGYKGLMQLALRSGGVKKLNAIPIYEGQIKNFNPLSEEMEFDFNTANNGEVVGYAAYLELVNGFNKTIYCSKEEIENHASKFSQSYRYDKNYKKSSSVWSTQFNEMALKTMIKKILKFAPLSTEMQLMQKVDQAEIKKVDIDDNGHVEVINSEFIDNNKSTIEIIEEKPTTEDMKTLMTIAQGNNFDVSKFAKDKWGINNLDNLSMEQFKELKEAAING